MSAPAITILPDASIVTAARRMESNAVKRLPVVDELGRLVGIVSRRDLIRVFMRPDEAIRRDVIDQVLRRTFWITPAEVPVEVHEGVVTLTGVVEHRAMIDVAVRLTQAIDGVVDVVNRLTADDDPLERTFEAMTQGRSNGKGRSNG
jgi:CBS domain-containing protein